MHPLHHFIRRHDALYFGFAQLRDLRDRAMWNLKRRPVPPPGTVKRRLLREYGERFGLATLVETGTFLGDTVWALRDQFRTIHSIELDDRLFRLARERFKRAHHIRIHHGDSDQVLSRVLDELSEPALFWLDGHYSGGGTARADADSPLSRELEEVLRRDYPHVVLIDDVRLLSGQDGYPSLAAVRDVASRFNARVHFQWDVAAITPAISARS